VSLGTSTKKFLRLLLHYRHKGDPVTLPINSRSHAPIAQRAMGIGFMENQVLDNEGGDKPLVVSLAKTKYLLDTSLDEVYRLIREGELKSYLEGHRRKVVFASIEALIARRLAATGGEFQRSSRVPPPPKQKRRAA
jgi:hypothetical protein